MDDELDEEEELDMEELDMEGFAVLLGTAGGSSFGLNTFKQDLMSILSPQKKFCITLSWWKDLRTGLKLTSQV